MPWPSFATSPSSLSPVAVGDTGSDGEQRNKDHHAGRNDHVSSLLFLSLLKFPPLQVTELTALPHVAGYTTATGSIKSQFLTYTFFSSCLKSNYSVFRCASHFFFFFCNFAGRHWEKANGIIM